MDSRERDAILWDITLAPAVMKLDTEKPLYVALRKAFGYLTPEEIDDIETALSEHEVAVGIACYDLGVAQGAGVKEQLTPVVA